jgi:DNA adenine methylase
MPYTIKKVKNGYKVCKKDEPTKCFSKEGIPEENAKKQMKAIVMNEIEGGLKPLTARIGGKVLLKKKIVDNYFPKPDSYTTYIEPFVGGGSIYFYKNKDNHNEVVNDIDPDLYTIFKGFQKYSAKKIADDVNGDYTEDDFENIVTSKPTNEYAKFLKVFLKYRLSFFGRGTNFGKPRINSNFKGYEERLKDTQILNVDYKDVIKKYNKPSSFFYLDPPARESTGNYRFTSIDIPELIKTLKTIKGKFLLSIANIDVKKEVFRPFKIITVPTKYVGRKTKGGQTQKVKEYLIMNYEPKMEGGTHRENVIKNFHLEDKGHSLEELSKVSSVPLSTLQEVYNRGIGAYKTNPQSVRMKGSFEKGVNAPMSQKLSKEQWAMARVYSFLDGSQKHDTDLR